MLRTFSLSTILAVTMCAALAVGCGKGDNNTLNNNKGENSNNPLADVGTDTETPNSETPDTDVPNTNEPDVGVDASEESDAEADAEPDAEEPGDPTRCETVIDPSDSGDYIELCEIEEGVVSHVKLEGVTTPATHATALFFLGYDDTPTANQGPIDEGQYRLMLYGGSSPAPPAQAGVQFGDAGATLFVAPHVVNGGTVCFDIHDGGADAAPYTVVWVDGVNDASCDDEMTLTLGSAVAIEASFGGLRGAVDKSAKAFYYQSGGLTTGPTITLSNATVTDATDIAATLECTTDLAEDNTWQTLCEPEAGAARHIRVEGIEATASSRYFYIVAGGTEDPPSTAEDGRFQFLGGQNHFSTSATQFKFNADIDTGQADFDLYLTPTTVCMDLTTSTTPGSMGNPGVTTTHVKFWATGSQGADCEDISTLTETSALFESDDAWTGAVDTSTFWGRLSNPDGLAAQRVILSRNPASR